MNKFYIGAAYYPELWDKSEIDKDIKLMKEYGMNCMRIGEFAWSTMEPSEGEYNFDVFKYVVDTIALTYAVPFFLMDSIIPKPEKKR